MFSFAAKTTGKQLIVKNEGICTLIGEPQVGKKPKLIDMAMGSFNGIVADLRSQGYQVTIL